MCTLCFFRGNSIQTADSCSEHLTNVYLCSCAAGLFVGAVTGGLIGLATESGLFRGTGIGAITGALVSIEVVDSSIRLWRSRQSGIWSILYVVSTRN